MKCSEYSTLGVYRNIMMPAKKSDFRRKKKVAEKFDPLNLDVVDLDLNDLGCSNDEKEYCNKYAKECSLNSNNEAICKIGETNTYQTNLKNMRIQK